MDIADLESTKLLRKNFTIELRVGARTRDMPDVDDKRDLGGAEEIHELGGGSRRMPDRVKAQRHIEEQVRVPGASSTSPLAGSGALV